MSYPTYGQLVTPTRNVQQQQRQAASAAGPAADGRTAAGATAAEPAAPDTSIINDGSISSPLPAQQHTFQAAAAQPQSIAAGCSPPAEPQDSMGGISSNHAPHQQPGFELPLVVSVSDPLRREAAGMLGMKASHIEYLVTARSSLPGWSQPEVSVRRRFNDFVGLAELLKAQFRGYFVPPRPEKNAVEGQRMSDAFVEERRAGLQKYLQRLATHPAIGRSEALQVFLETPGDLSSSMRWSGMLPASASVLEGAGKFSMQLIGRESRVVDPVSAAQPAARSKDLMRAMKEAAQGIGMRGGREVPLEELDLRRLREAAEEMREQLSLTSKAAEKLVGKLDQLGSTAGDLGLSMFKVAKFEEAEGGALASYTGTLRYSSGLIADQKRTAAALVRVSKMMGKVTGRVAQELGTLHDNLAAVPAAVRGYMSREHQMLTWHTLEGDLEAKQKALAEADKSKVKRVDELRTDVARLELSIGAAKAEYDKIKAANVAETARFAAERRAEYSVMLENFTATQVGLCR
ncbi:hypothetical protein COO60DRAFT_892770 [Scenedesmus sp. NREL 46B-D3]|nr:hypothetical protein COO60DRAFT_892770 [Scenedesmus sp. NREL 46B-D3]